MNQALNQPLSIAVIGGGAAGMMAALTAQETAPDARVVLFEKNAELGAKVMISGGGRCNVTTGITDVRELVLNYPRGGKFLLTAFFAFSPADVCLWFEEHGVPLKVEDDLRVFPKSDTGRDVMSCLHDNLLKKGVVVRLKTAVETAEKLNTKFVLTVKGDGAKEHFDRVIITTGGNAYRHTGSTGDGYAFARALGHTLTPLSHSLGAFVVAQSSIKELAGVSFERAQLTVRSLDSTQKWEQTGPFVFTHKGLSGPAVFVLSSYSAFEQYSAENPLQLSLDLFPDLTDNQLREKLDDLCTKQSRKFVANLLDALLPPKMCAAVMNHAKIPPTLTASHLTKEQRLGIVTFLKNMQLSVVGRAAGEEFVTAGGVPLNEVDPRTMQSKRTPGLFFAGEILDVDGFTGGFNLQAAWATGRLAGTSIL